MQIHKSMQANREMTEAQVYQKLTALCARAEHCQQDMLDKMRQWGVPAPVQAGIMERLTTERYVDDERYARAFVHEKTTYNRWGRRKVEQALRMKRIDDDVVRRVMDEVEPLVYASALAPLLQQKRRSVRAASAYELNAKLVKFALSRGFSLDEIKQCLDVDDVADALD